MGLSVSEPAASAFKPVLLSAAFSPGYLCTESGTGHWRAHGRHIAKPLVSIFRRPSKAECATARSCSEQRIGPAGGFSHASTPGPTTIGEGALGVPQTLNCCRVPAVRRNAFGPGAEVLFALQTAWRGWNFDGWKSVGSSDSAVHPYGAGVFASGYGRFGNCCRVRTTPPPVAQPQNRPECGRFSLATTSNAKAKPILRWKPIGVAGGVK